MPKINVLEVGDGQPVLTRYAKYRKTMKFKENEFGKNEKQINGPFCFDNYAYDKSIISFKLNKKEQESQNYSNDAEIKLNEENQVKQIKVIGGVGSQVIDPSLEWTLKRTLYVHGPDQILPSTAVTTCDPRGAVRIVDVGPGSGRRRPISVPSLLEQATRKAPKRTALAIKRDGKWQKWSYWEYLQDVRAVAKAFIALGLERFHSVCILGFNTPEWFQADLGAIFAGGFAAGIYTTNSPEATAFCAVDSKANIFVVEDEKQLEKVLKVRAQLPHLKAIIQYSGEPSHEGVLSWAKLLSMGDNLPDKYLDERLSQIAINQCCTLIYTSGTTGNPKGVMLNHDNLTWTAYSNSQWCRFRDCKEEYISFLPLSHVAAQLADIYCPLTCCATVFFGDKDALKGSLISTMKEVQPSKFFAVPRLWEKMYETMQEVGRSTTGVKKILATWAKEKGLEYNLKRMEGIENPSTLGFWIANKLILSKVRAALGFSRCDLHLSGAAPISQEILKYFMSLNIVVTEVYGMSECSGPNCMGIESAFRLGSCGKTMTGCLTKIHKPNESGDGEILMGGRNVSMGYLNQKEKTAAAFDQMGWLHSEDVGHLDKDGYLFITGRLKEILITAGGENVAPIPIEDRVKFELPFVSQAVVLGDRLKFLSVLLTVKTDVDKDTQEPMETLLSHAKDWIQQHGECHVATVADLLTELYSNNNKKLLGAIQSGIDAVNSKAPSQAQKLQKWHVLPSDFSTPGGELGPTLKLKRQVVYDKYKETIGNMYK